MLSADETKSIAEYLVGKSGAVVSHPFGDNPAVYSLDDTPFAYLDSGKQLLRLSLRADPQLSKVLREKYEEVSPGQKLNPKQWNTIVVSGQLSLSELKALIDHSYQLVEQINRSTEQAS